MKAELFSTLKQSVEMLQNDMTKEEEPVWLGTLWNVDASLAKMAEKYLATENQKQFDLLDKIAIENEKKNQWIRELEECLQGFELALYNASDEFVPTPIHEAMNKAKQLLNQKP